MPKLADKCELCGKPIIKAIKNCPQCEAKLKAAEQEIHESRVRLIPELLWEKRRYEIAKEVMPRLHIGSGCSAEQDAAEAVHIADALIAELKKRVTI